MLDDNDTSIKNVYLKVSDYVKYRNVIYYDKLGERFFELRTCKGDVFLVFDIIDTVDDLMMIEPIMKFINLAISNTCRVVPIFTYFPYMLNDKEISTPKAYQPNLYKTTLDMVEKHFFGGEPVHVFEPHATSIAYGKTLMLQDSSGMVLDHILKLLKRFDKKEEWNNFAVCFPNQETKRKFRNVASVQKHFCFDKEGYSVYDSLPEDTHILVVRDIYTPEDLEDMKAPEHMSQRLGIKKDNMHLWVTHLNQHSSYDKLKIYYSTIANSSSNKYTTLQSIRDNLDINDESYTYDVFEYIKNMEFPTEEA